MRPPIQRPVVQPAPEPAPEPAPASPPNTPASATPEAASSEPAPPPERVQPEAALPRFDDPTIPVAIDPIDPIDPIGLEPEPPPLRAIPFDGRGRLAIGGLLVGAGAATVASSIALEVDGAPPKYWAPMMAAGIGGTIVGSVLIVVGRRKLRSYREWESSLPRVNQSRKVSANGREALARAENSGQTESIPRQGLGLVAPACVLMIGGTILAVGGATLWQSQEFGVQFPWDYSLPAPEAALGIGIGSFVVGATLMGIGATRSKRFTTWRQDTSNPTARLHLTPIFGPIRGGAQLGLFSRF
ncbi:hypothetical protein DB30_00452 [Enhygromyxa salina]|uniref:Uncharacterized protein n=1 Tax=Enhygromyxa salina TaxID=215803 RepID=A0A0C1Z6J9_9BACT|nr:hypothetical protein DB30_00452 [Enhygromyxa salina]